MKRIQKFIAMGSSLLIVCFMAVAGVLAAGSLSTTVTVNIHHDGTVSAMVYVATCSNDVGGSYYQSNAVTESTFDTTGSSSALVYDAKNFTENNALQTTNITNFTTDADSFKFNDAGVLEIYFLFANYDLGATLTYTITLTYGAGEVATPTNFTKNASSSELTNLIGKSAGVGTPTKGLCKIIYNVASLNQEFTSGEQINIDILLEKAEPV